jgi:hypothetical protein
MLSLTALNVPEINLALGWLWITLGFISGGLMGFNFRFFKENWQGGYSSLKRRFYRLGHISFFGLGLINLLFYFTVQSLTASGRFVELASWALVVGAITMPICCIVVANAPKFKYIIYLPSGSLIIGGFFTIVGVL